MWVGCAEALIPLYLVWTSDFWVGNMSFVLNQSRNRKTRNLTLAA